MPFVVSLRDVINEMADIGDDQTAFLNRRTGELVSLTDEQRYVLENGRAADAPECQRDLQKVLQTGDLLELPSSFEHHEYSVVEQFCHSIKDPDHQERLLAAIHGKRAFRDFKAIIASLGLDGAWAHFRNRAYEELAVAWLQQNEIAYDQAA